MINEYLFHISIEKKFSDNTVTSYEKVLKTYSLFLELHSLTIFEIEDKDLKFYINELYSLKYSKATIAQHISVIKSFYKFLTKKYKTINPSESLVYPKLDKKLPHFLFFSEMEELLEQLEQSELRVYLIFVFIYATGVRVSELTNIMLYDIYDGYVEVVGKGNKKRKVPISEYVVVKIQQYINERDVDSNYLFVNKRGKQLSPRGISYLMNKELNELAIQYKVTPHTLRHTFASHLLSNGMDIKIVQEILGHSSLTTTQLYTHISKSELIDTYNMVSKRNENE